MVATIVAYFDDIYLVAPTPADLVPILDAIAPRLDLYELRLNAKKSTLLANRFVHVRSMTIQEDTLEALLPDQHHRVLGVWLNAAGNMADHRARQRVLTMRAACACARCLPHRVARCVASQG